VQKGGLDHGAGQVGGLVAKDRLEMSAEPAQGSFQPSPAIFRLPVRPLCLRFKEELQARHRRADSSYKSLGLQGARPEELLVPRSCRQSALQDGNVLRGSRTRLRNRVFGAMDALAVKMIRHGQLARRPAGTGGI
jgi:hypothetical protein